MWQVQRMAIVAALLATSALQPAIAQQAKAPAAQSLTQARKALSDGVKSYRAGKTTTAFSQLDKAISGGGLGPKELAKALYYRGLVHRKLGSPAKSISDLDSAIYLAGGLSEKERANAIKNRDLAYKDAGVKPRPVATAAQPAATKPVASESKPKPKQAVARKPKATSSGSTDPWQTTTKGSPPATLAAAPTSAPAASNNPLAGVGNFFSGLFGGSSSGAAAKTAAAAPSTTGSLSGPTSAVSSWNNNTSVTGTSKNAARAVGKKPAAAARKTTVVRKVPAQKSRPASAAGSGRFILNAGAERSQAAAQALAQRIKQAHALGGREPQVHAAKYGNMGTFYRVHIGSYSRSDEPKKLCAALKSSGVDCWVSGK